MMKILCCYSFLSILPCLSIRISASVKSRASHLVPLSSYVTCSYRHVSLIQSAAETNETDATIVSGDSTAAVNKTPELDSDISLKLQLDFNDFKSFFGRVVDTVDDTLLHYKRVFLPAAKTAFNIDRDIKTSQGSKPRLIILGCGWGGHALTKIIDHESFDVVVVSAVGTVDTSSITESVKQSNPSITYVQGSVSSVDYERHQIEIETYSSLNDDGSAALKKYYLDYSQLVYAVGAKAGTFGIKGVREYCFLLKEVGDARKLRRALLRCFDEASFPGVDDEKRRNLLKFLIIGTGPTGIEFAGELTDLLRTDIPKLFPDLIPYISLRIISSASTILPMFDKVLQAKGMQTLAEAGADIMLNCFVAEIKPGYAVLDDGTRIPFSLCFWAGGIEARQLTLDLIDKVPGQKDMIGSKRGQLTVDKFLRVKGIPDGSIIGIGDAVRVEGENYPATGQVAAQQGAYVARLLNRGYLLDGIEPPRTKSMVENASSLSLAKISDWIKLRGGLYAYSFHFLNLGLLAYVGSGSGLAQMEGGDNSRLFDASGTIGFFLWRSTYIVKQVSTRCRVCVLIDWTKSKVFGRDFTSPAEYLDSRE